MLRLRNFLKENQPGLQLSVDGVSCWADGQNAFNLEGPHMGGMFEYGYFAASGMADFISLTEEDLKRQNLEGYHEEKQMNEAESKEKEEGENIL